MNTDDLTVHDRLAIQMAYAVPLLRDLQAILGDDVVLDALAERLRRRTEEAAASARPRRVGETKVMFAFEQFAAGGALEYETLVDEADAIDVDVQRCAYATLMQDLDAADLGDLLICSEDHVAVARAGTRLTRTETHMLGADRCDFRFRSGG